MRKMTKLEKEREQYFKKQELNYGGFCGDCGEGLHPLLNDDIENFGECQFNGKHPEYKHTCFKCGKEFTIRHVIDTDKPTCDDCFEKLKDIKTAKQYSKFVGE